MTLCSVESMAGSRNCSRGERELCVAGLEGGAHLLLLLDDVVDSVILLDDGILVGLMLIGKLLVLAVDLPR